MSGGLKSGLIFGGLQVLLMIGFSLMGAVLNVAGPAFGTLGLLCCGPLGTLLVSALAGNIGVRWNKAPVGIGQGVLAGGLVGAGALIGSLLLWIGLLLAVNAAAQSDPALFEQILRDALSQQPGVELTPQDFQSLMTFAIPAVGLCVGLLALLFALAGGALGGWLALRGRAPAPPEEAMGWTELDR